MIHTHFAQLARAYSICAADTYTLDTHVTLTRTYLQTRPYDDIQTYATIARHPLADIHTDAVPLQFVALRVATTELIEGLCYKLIMLGVPIDGTTSVYCDK